MQVGASAQLKSTESQTRRRPKSQRRTRPQVNLDHTIITAPIDGIVIQRSVDVGQTVAASMQAPTLFIIAADLTKMQVNANIDESDVGRIRPGQHVTFRVDAYPDRQFDGTVAQVRLQPASVQNVVTYSTVIDVPNPRAEAQAGHDGEREHRRSRGKSNVLRVPNAALRFRPTTDMFAALNQDVPPEARGGLGGAAERGGSGGRGGAAGQRRVRRPAAPAAPPAATRRAGAPAAQAAAATAPVGRGQRRRAIAAAQGDGRSGNGSAADPAAERRSRRRPGGRRAADAASIRT